jgi:glycosyltransferase involved in cell wall biosynthesis
MTPISALLIVKNEELFIERALESVCWCDEIVVVDSFSTDRTPEIVNRPNAAWSKKVKWIQQPWLGYSGQRNFALAQAQHDWVFFLDGDECCSSELKIEIQNILSQPNPTPKIFKVRRQEYFLGRPIHHGIWNPSMPTRLFPKSGIRFQGEVHEGVLSPYPNESINAPILHVEDLRMERFLQKLNSYTTLQAQADFDSGMRTHFGKILLAFPAMLYKKFIYYKGWRDGSYGFVISVLEGLSRTVRHLKVWQLQELQKRRK